MYHSPIQYVIPKFHWWGRAASRIFAVAKAHVLERTTDGAPVLPQLVQCTQLLSKDLTTLLIIFEEVTIYSRKKNDQ